MTNISRMDAAKDIDKVFVNVVLNNSGNRVGLVSYASDIPTGYIYPLSEDNQSLINEIDDYEAKTGVGQRCLCCAIHDAGAMLTNPLRKNYILVMSDGSAEKTTPSKCPANYTGDPVQDAINEACYAYRTRGILVYAVGFGQDANNTLLQEIAACGNGKWASSNNYTGLLNIYKEFGSEIANQSIIFEYQKVASSLFNSTLYPDSFIELNYTPLIIPYEYGEISLKREGNRTRDYSGDDIDVPCKEGMYNISDKVKVIDARMTSYSSSFWTDRLSLNSSATTGWTTTFNLTDFGYDYLILGDPYTVEVPANLIAAGSNNICIGTGFNASNATGGSPDDRLIYTLRVRGSVPYGNVNETYDGALDDAIQRLIDEVGDYVDLTTDEIGTEISSIENIPYMWGPATARMSAWV
jgi:hypothetical protein